MDVRGENDVAFVHRTGSGQIAQSVEQGTENPRVGGSIPSLPISFHGAHCSVIDYLTALLPCV